MNIKSLLIGSAAALAAVSGAQAADAIVAAEPEPMEYVRVCDAFGTGFFYIPGTETCLKIGGFVRFQVGFARDEVAASVANGGLGMGYGNGITTQSDWDAFTRAQVTFDARNDTELGTLRSFIALQADSDNEADGGGGLGVDEAYIELGGFKVGYFWSWWDNGINGETDSLGNVTRFNSVAYTYDGGTWRAGLSVDEIEKSVYTRVGDARVMPVLSLVPGVVTPGNALHNNLGVAATVGFSLGGVNLDILGGYDNAVREGAIRAIVSAEVGPGTLQLAGVWASDPNAYWDASEWSIAASYSFKATEKLTITPAVQYFDDLNNGGVIKGDATNVSGAYGFGRDDAWRVGLTVGYQIVEGLDFLGTVDYNKVNFAAAGVPDEDFTRGFLRLQRNF